MKLKCSLFLFLFLLFSTQALTQEKGKTKGGPSGMKRSKSLSFDDSVVEGLNTNPLDSIETVGKKDRDAMPHLYRKKLNFKKELKDSSLELGTKP